MEKDIHRKEFSIDEMLSFAWNKFRDNFKTIAMITAIIYIPINIMLWFMMPEEATIESLGSYMRIVNIFEGYVGIISKMAVAYVIMRALDGKKTDESEALKKSISRWVPAIWTNIVCSVFLIGLFLLLILPGIAYYVYWIFVPYIVILNGKSGKGALDYSKEIVSGRWWTVAGYSLVFGVMGAIAGTVIGFISGTISGIISGGMAVDVATSTICDILCSYFDVLGVIFFLNFEATRKKELDELKDKIITEKKD